MFVNTNVAALNAWRNLENTQNDMTGVLQQMSSGLRINTAADDPAGLAISQQMQSQIGGLNQAYLNSQSGVSLLQTTDGALGQIQNILQSMRSLASEAATATMNSTDTQNLQVEMNQYASEITQVTNTTQFNNINLLGGAFTNQNLQVGANQGQSLGVTLNAADAYTLGVTGSQLSNLSDTNNITNGVSNMTTAGVPAGTGYQLATTTTDWSASNYTQTNTGTADTSAAITAVSGTYNGSKADNITFTMTATSAGAAPATLTYTDSTHSSPQTLTLNASQQGTIDGVTFTFHNALTASSTYTIGVTLNPFSTSATLTGGLSTASPLTGPLATGTNVSLSTTGQSLSFQTGSGLNTLTTAGTSTYALTTVANGLGTATYGGGFSASTKTDTATLDVSQTGSAATTYTNGTGNASANDSNGNASGINITTQSNAQAALTAIDTAINTLSTERANVGAYQNRLQFASSDVQTTSQNLTAARAGIMDADMAKEMSNLSKDQVLMQAGVGMLAQANQVPQMLLKMLP